MSTAVASALVGDLILVRLLTPGKRPPGPSKLRAELSRFFKQPPAADRWQEHIDELVDAGLLTTGPSRLTDAGRARALQFLGVESLPSRADWKTVRVHYLVPKALGIAADAEETRRRTAKKDGLGALLLQIHYDLAPDVATSLPRALEALACKKLGFPAETSLRAVKQVVLTRLVDGDGPLSKKQIETQLPRHALKASKAGLDGLREAILQRWLDGDGGTLAPSEDIGAAAVPTERVFDLQAFAATVRAAARDCPRGRFGDNKVFISHIWRHLRGEPSFPPLDLSEFKGRLLEANQAGLLYLSRADLVQAMDPNDVRESETPYLNAVFHFVLLEGDRP